MKTNKMLYIFALALVSGSIHHIQSDFAFRTPSSVEEEKFIVEINDSKEANEVLDDTDTELNEEVMKQIDAVVNVIKEHEQEEMIQSQIAPILEVIKKNENEESSAKTYAIVEDEGQIKTQSLDLDDLNRRVGECQPKKKEVDKDVKELLADKASLLKEIAELKKKHESKAKEEVKPVKLAEVNVTDYMSQISSLLTSQQMLMKSQLELMSLMQQQAQGFDPSSLYSPYAIDYYKFDAAQRMSNRMYRPFNSLSDSFDSYGSDGGGIGIAHSSHGINRGHGIFESDKSLSMIRPMPDSYDSFAFPHRSFGNKMINPDYSSMTPFSMNHSMTGVNFNRIQF